MASTSSACLVLATLGWSAAFGFSTAHGQVLAPEQRQRIDTAVPPRAPAKPRRPRRLLVVNLQMRNGALVQGPSHAALDAQNYALQEMGKRTGADEAVCMSC
jgi:hypothetical protein